LIDDYQFLLLLLSSLLNTFAASWRWLSANAMNRWHTTRLALSSCSCSATEKSFVLRTTHWTNQIFFFVLSSWS
jgi:hypothetical protein